VGALRRPRLAARAVGPNHSSGLSWLSARAGPGIHFASLHSSGGASAWDTATAFGFQVGGSAAFNLSPTMLVGLDALWTFAEATFSGIDTRIDGVIVSVKLGYRL